MERHLNLVSVASQVEEKRIFPRFPFSSLTFKASCNNEITFSIADISYSGMQINLKNGKHILKENNIIDGLIHWHGREVKVSAQVVWVEGDRIGLSFDEEEQKNVKEFLSISNIVKGLRPLHLHSLGIEKPQNLKYWLKAASALEVFVWTYPNGEFEKFQFVFVSKFVEWVDGKGIKTGSIGEKENRETPLYTENELTVSMDNDPDEVKLKFALDCLEHIGDDKLPSDTRGFIRRKLSN